MIDSQDLARARVQQAKLLLDGSPVSATANRDEWAERVAMAALELARQGWVPPHADIFKARELAAALMPIHEADFIAGKLDDDFRMQCICKGIDLGRELTEEEYELAERG